MRGSNRYGTSNISALKWRKEVEKERDHGESETRQSKRDFNQR